MKPSEARKKPHNPPGYKGNRGPDFTARLVRLRFRISGRSRGRSGLSLVELSVVILVLGILFSILFGVFFGVSRITKRASPISLGKQRALLALENIRGSLSQTYYHRDIKRLVFVGKKAGPKDNRRDRLTFAAVHQGAAAIGAAAIREVSFYIRDSNDQEGGGILMRREDQMVDDQPGTGGAHYELLANVVSLEFGYSLNGRKYEDEWHHENYRRIPRLVKIRLRVKIGKQVHRFETLAYIGLYMY